MYIIPLKNSEKNNKKEKKKRRLLLFREIKKGAKKSKSFSDTFVESPFKYTQETIWIGS